MRGIGSGWLAGSATALSGVWLATAGACFFPAHADEPQLLGELRHVDERRADGRVTRVSDRQPDGEDITAGAYLYAEDRLSLTGVIVTVVVCSREEKHSAMTVALQLQIPTGCSGRELSPEPAAGASYAAHETNGMSRYVVVVGDTLYSISRQYALPLKLLMDANNIDNPDRLLVGQTLLIPGEPVEQYVVDSSSSIQETAAAPRTVSSVGDVAAGALGPNNAQVAATSDISQLDLTPGTVVLPAPASGSASIDGSLTDNTAQGLPLSAGVFIAPASGRIDTFFEEGRSNGIRVVVDNRAVRAISDGIVLYSDFHSEYKDLIILRHEGGFVSVYYNLFTREVKKGDEVIRGKILGAARETIYFELREGGVPIDPLPLVGTAIWQ